jgi:hypothetical protein
MKRVLLLLTALLLLPNACFAAPPHAELLSVTKISDRAPHSAFTDLIFWKGQFICAFREGRGHMSSDGKIRILSSPDGNTWKSVALLELKDYDLRDASLSVMPDGRLMLNGGASRRPKDGDHTPTENFVAFSDDGTSWTTPVQKEFVEPGRWLWRVTWNRHGKAYGVLYQAGGGANASSLLVTSDGQDYQKLVPTLLDNGRPTEAVLRFDDQENLYCLQRRDGQPPANTAMLGMSTPPYTNWEWHDLGQFLGGPNLIHLPGGDWIAGGRMIRDGKPKTVLAKLDVVKHALEPILELPSGGDTSYPGFVLRDGILYVSYYSSHEGNGRIYFAKVKLQNNRQTANDDNTNAGSKTSNNDAAPLTPKQAKVCDELHLDKQLVAELLNKPLYRFTEQVIGTYLSFLAALEPGDARLRERIAHLARKNIGQPYELYLLGEAPYETYDPQPVYCLGKSDCVVFSEHTYAMALSHDWPSFMAMLQRIRYRDGHIGVTTRNHYTEADWNKANKWLVKDITAELAGDKAVKFHQAIDRKNFFKKRYKLDVDLPGQQFNDVFIPFEAIDQAKPNLQDGDFVNIIRGTVNKNAPPSDLSNTFGGNAWAGHVGLIVHGDDGEVHLIHSTVPAVREEPIDEYIARSTKTMPEDDAKGKPRLLGFKFLRIRQHPVKNLQGIDGDHAPKVTLPDGSKANF